MFYFLSNREIEAQESGIEGILNRLEKERNRTLGLGFREKDIISSGNNEDKDNSHHRSTTDSVSKFYFFKMLLVAL